MSTTIFKVQSGSHLYGTNTPESDKDYISILMPSIGDLLGLERVNFVDDSTKSSDVKRKNTADDVDDHKYMLHYFLKLVMDGNPNLTEVLFAHKDAIEIITPVYREIVDLLPNLISRKHISSFLGFSTSQMNKLEVKSKRLNSLKMAKEFLELEYKPEELNGQIKYDMNEYVASVLNNTVEYYKGDKQNVEHFHKGLSPQITYHKIKEEYEKYGWRVNTETFNKLKYDTKFASHAVRLLIEAQQLIKYGRIFFPLEEKKLILSIKNGDYDLVRLKDLYELILSETKELVKINENKLPETANYQYMNDWLTKTYYTYIKDCGL